MRDTRQVPDQRLCVTSIEGPGEAFPLRPDDQDPFHSGRRLWLSVKLTAGAITAELTSRHVHSAL